MTSPNNQFRSNAWNLADPDSFALSSSSSSSSEGSGGSNSSQAERAERADPEPNALSRQGVPHPSPRPRAATLPAHDHGTSSDVKVNDSSGNAHGGSVNVPFFPSTFLSLEDKPSIPPSSPRPKPVRLSSSSPPSMSLGDGTSSLASPQTPQQTRSGSENERPTVPALSYRREGPAFKIPGRPASSSAWSPWFGIDPDGEKHGRGRKGERRGDSRPSMPQTPTQEPGSRRHSLSHIPERDRALFSTHPKHGISTYVMAPTPEEARVAVRDTSKGGNMGPRGLVFTPSDIPDGYHLESMQGRWRQDGVEEFRKIERSIRRNSSSAYRAQVDEISRCQEHTKHADVDWARRAAAQSDTGPGSDGTWGGQGIRLPIHMQLSAIDPDGPVNRPRRHSSSYKILTKLYKDYHLVFESVSSREPDRAASPKKRVASEQLQSNCGKKQKRSKRKGSTGSQTDANIAADQTSDKEQPRPKECNFCGGQAADARD